MADAIGAISIACIVDARSAIGAIASIGDAGTTIDATS